MKELNFMDIEVPKLKITLRSGIELQLVLPSVTLIERLRSGVKRLSKSITENNLSDVRKYYELAAELISCNLSKTTITADDLEMGEHFRIEDIVEFFEGYVEFIDEASSTKN